jgi:hypothetical protein
MKPKTGFESGTSPTVSKNGAPILTGRGLEETKRRIMAAFQQIRQHLPAQPLPPPQEPQVVAVYTEEQEVRFHARVKKLLALSSSHITTSRRVVYEIVAPTKSAEELIAEAMRRFNER